LSPQPQIEPTIIVPFALRSIVRQGSPRHAIGLVTTEVPAARPVLANLEAFARAVRGDAPYPIAGTEIVATSAVMEAIFRSSETGKVEPVPD
jgi:hypothetical protein